MSLKEEIVELLKKEGEMKLSDIYAHFPEKPKPSVRCVLNKGVKNGTFVRKRKATYALPGRVKNAEKERKPEKEGKEKSISVEMDKKSKIKDKGNGNKNKDYIAALIKGIERYTGMSIAGETKITFEEVKARLKGKGYEVTKLPNLNIEEALRNPPMTAAVGLTGERKEEMRLPEEALKKTPKKGTVLKHPAEEKYWDLDLLRKTMRDAGLPFDRKTKRNLRFYVRNSSLLAFVKEQDFVIVIAEYMPGETPENVCVLSRV